MLWDKIKIIGFGILLPVFFSVFFASPSYAINDFTLTNPNAGANYVLCAPENWRMDVPLCTDYQYLIYSAENFNSSSELTFNSSFSPSTIRLSVFSSGVLTFDSPLTASDYIRISILNKVNDTLSLTISDHAPAGDCPVCPEPEPEEPCPEIPENPYDDKFDRIIQAIYTIGGILLVLYFFFCIYRMILKNSGVNNL